VKVTLFHTGFPEYVMGLANALCSRARVTVIHPESLSPTCQALARSEVSLRGFEKPKLRRDLRNIAAMRQAFELVLNSKPDLVHVQEMCDYSYDLFSAFASFPPLVTTIHDVKPHPGDGHAAPGLQYSKAIGCWRSRRIIVHTPEMRVQLSARFRIKTNRIDVIPHGELGSLYRQAAKAGGITSASRDPFTLLFFGRIWRYKGLRYLLEAFPMIKKEVPGARLLICGRGGDLDDNARLIASLPDVEVRDSFIPCQEVASLFERASVVVLPYIEASQSGVSAIAFTTGTVVVASRVGGLAELMSHAETGVLVEPRNASALSQEIVLLLKDAEYQARIRGAAHALGTTELSWDVIAEKTLTTYEAALDS